MPRFSIISPSYRQLDLLRRAVLSVRDQSGGSLGIEHLVQDGGSEGLEAAGITGAEHGGYRLEVRSEPDGGMYDALNRGLRRASGEFCAWLNSDEQYLPGTLARVARFFEEHPGVDVVCGDAILIDMQGRALSYRRAVRPGRLHLRLAHLSTLSCATFFRRTSVVDAGLLFDPAWRSIGDAVWMDSLLRAGLRVGTVSEPLAVFTFTGQNTSESPLARRETEQWRKGKDAPPRWLKAPVVLAHRLAKMGAGAYRRRNLSYSIYLGSGTERTRMEASGLGWNWPSEAPGE